jgi:hypothetical protein
MIVPQTAMVKFPPCTAKEFSTHSHSVGTEEAGETARAILNFEICAILLVCAGLAAVILVVQHCNRTTTSVYMYVWMDEWMNEWMDG